MNPLDHAIAFLTTRLRPAISGQSGHDQTMGAACACVHDFGLGEPEAMIALQAWNAICQPPWQESDLLHKVRDALKQPPKNGKPRGWRLKKGSSYIYGVSAPPTQPKPAAGPDKPTGRVYDLDDNTELLDPIPDGTRKLLTAAFNPGEFVALSQSVIRDGENKGTPKDKGITLTREAWLEKLNKYEGDPNRFFAAADGAYVRVNPMRDGGSKDADVTALRHALLEFDSMTLEEQWALILESKVPCTAVLLSGGRSVHAWVRVEAKTIEEYQEAVDCLYAHFAHYQPDKKNKNPSRFSRLPGMVRGQKKQELLSLRIGAPSFQEWLRQKEDEAVPEPDAWIDKQLVPADDPSVLIGPGRWLTRGNGVILSGPTGIGKSTLVASLCFAWGLGKPSLGFVPNKPLKILIIQAEDDDGDLAEMKDGALHSLGELTEADRDILRKHVRVFTERAMTGPKFIQRVLLPLVRRLKPDLIVLNPLSAYFGADLNKQEVVAAFFRNTLNPVLAEFNCCILVIHHTPKPTKERKMMQAGELAYSGSGSADLANWARESMDLRPTKGGLCELTLTKRWRRLGWVDAEGNLTAARILAYGLDGKLYWREADQTALSQKDKRPEDLVSDDDILSLFPKEWKQPVDALLTTRETRHQITKKRWPRDPIVARVDGLVRQGRLGVTSGKCNAKYCGRPEAVEAFNQERASRPQETSASERPKDKRKRRHKK